MIQNLQYYLPALTIGRGSDSGPSAARPRIYERRGADDQPVVCHVTPAASLIEQEAEGINGDQVATFKLSRSSPGGVLA